MTTSSNPSQQQIAFAYGQYLKLRNGDSAAAMTDLQTFIAGYSAPPPADPTHADMVLETPAMIGNTIFAAGMPWFAVVQRAKIEYDERGAAQPSAVRIAEFREWVEQGMPGQQYASTP